MSEPFRHTRHLWRMLVLFLVWIGVFLLVRGKFVPEDFGKYGHYRPAAADEAAAMQPVFAGKRACLECHEEVSQDPKLNRHAGLSCEACHGPQAQHAGDPSIAPGRPAKDNALCLGCHLASEARPVWFKQIKPAEHMEGACVECHQPHTPAL